MHGDTAGLTAHGGCGCEFHKLLNDVCDPECRGEACFNDNGACTRVQVGCPGCEDDWLNDGECDDECQTQACGWDMGDCVFANGSLVTPQKERCTRSCPASWVNDGECDPACNVETCNFDGGDCAPTPCAYTAPRSKSWCVLGGPSNARVPRAATTRRLSPPASLPPYRRRFDLGAFDAHALELPLATLAPHLASNPALAGKDGRVSLRVCTQTDLATLCEGADTPATLRGAAAALSFVAPGARCVTQSLGALKDKRVGLIARAHGDTTTPAGVNLSFYNGSACGNERSPRIERGGRMIRSSVHFVLMCEPSALSPELVSWTHTEATCSWEFGFRYAGGNTIGSRPKPHTAHPTSHTLQVRRRLRGREVGGEVWRVRGGLPAELGRRPHLRPRVQRHGVRVRRRRLHRRRAPLRREVPFRVARRRSLRRRVRDGGVRPRRRR